MAKKGKRRSDQLPVLHSDAAGVDVSFGPADNVTRHWRQELPMTV